MQPLTSFDHLDDLLRAPRVILLKHSWRCPISTAAHAEMSAFLEAHPDADVYLLDVIADRELSTEVARRLDIRHASPQAIVLRDGEPLWSGSHFAITASAIARRFVDHPPVTDAA
jgi:bacillithiol system protein YtxJ